MLDNEGFEKFYIQKGTTTRNSSFIREFVDQVVITKQIKVRIKILYKYVFETRSILNFIRIDTEGSEIHIIKGGLEVIQSYKPILITELDSKAA